MIPDLPGRVDSPLAAGGEGNPAGEGPGTENPSPTGRICDVIDCAAEHFAKGLCNYHYHRRRESKEIPPRLAPIVVVCPDDLISQVTGLVDHDARAVFVLLWRAIGYWHLQGLLEDSA